MISPMREQMLLAMTSILKDMFVDICFLEIDIFKISQASTLDKIFIYHAGLNRFYMKVDNHIDAMLFYESSRLSNGL